MSLVAPGDVLDYSLPLMPQITTMRIDTALLGKIAANLLFDRMRTADAGVHVLKVKEQLVRRGSCLQLANGLSRSDRAGGTDDVTREGVPGICTRAAGPGAHRLFRPPLLGDRRAELRAACGSTWALPARPVRVYDPIQQLAVLDDDVLERFGVDTVEMGRGFSHADSDWQEWTLPDGTPCLMPAWVKPGAQARGMGHEVGSPARSLAACRTARCTSSR